MISAAKQRRTEKVKDELRKLVAIEGNKHCAICATRGPIYAVLDFQIFVCTTCSAMHRSLQHKVKGISMSEFTDDEVAALRVGGNGRAATVWKAGYHAPPPPPGDEYRVKECIRVCFHERHYFNREAFAQLQDDIANALLPPVKVLTSLDAVGPITTSQQPMPAPQPMSAQQPPPKPSTTQLESTDMFASPARTVAPATVAPAKESISKDAFDDFFASRAAPVASASAPPQRQSTAVVDDMFGPMSSAVAAPSRTTTSSSSLDFFSQPSHPHAGHALPSPPQPQQNSGMDFFSQPSSGPSVPSQQMHGDFFCAPSAAKGDMFTPTVWERRPAHNEVLPTAPVASVSAPPPTHHMSNAFADLDPFGGRRK